MVEISHKFRTNLTHAIKYTESRPKEPRFINEFIGLLHQYILKLKAENPSLTLDDLRKRLDDDIMELAKPVYVSSYVPEKYIEYAANLYLSKHPEKLDELLTKIQKEGLQPTKPYFVSHPSLEENLLEYLCVLQADFTNIVGDYRKDGLDDYLRELIDDPSLSVQEKWRKANAYIKGSILPIYQKVCTTAVRTCLFGVKGYLQEDERILEKDLRKDLADSLVAMTTQLDRLGLLGRYNRIHNTRMQRLALENLNYTDKDLETILNANYLDKLSIDDLLGLNVTWMNRYLKELDTYSEAMFAIQEFDLLSELYTADKPRATYVIENDLREMLVKMNTLYQPSEIFFQKMQQEADELPEDYAYTEEEEKGRYVLWSYDPLVRQTSQDYGDDYAEYFNFSLPKSENDLEKDLRYYARLQNPISSAKLTKDAFVTCLLISLEMNPELVNGGIIIDDSHSQEDLITRRFVGVALDCNLTTPIRVHIRRDFLEDFLQSYQGNSLIRVYEGNNDFQDLNGKPLANILTLPFDKKIEKAIKGYHAKGNIPHDEQLVHFIDHLKFLKNPKHVPEHLKTLIVNGKGKTEKVFKSRFFDIQTGIIYELTENGLVPIVNDTNKTALSARKGDDDFVI